MTNTDRPFMGPKPKDTEPVWVTPFRAEDDTIRDANDNHVGSVSGDASSPEEDESLAELIVALVNEYVSTRESSAPKVDTNAPFVGRVIVRVGEAIQIEPEHVSFAYEVTPGRFWFAANRDAALAETYWDDTRGWPIEQYEAAYFLDVATGGFVPASSPSEGHGD